MKHASFFFWGTSVLCGLLRFLPHPLHVTPLTAYMLFAGIRGQTKDHFFCAIIPLLCIDLYLFGPHVTMPAVYIAFYGIYVLGSMTQRILATVKTQDPRNNQRFTGLIPVGVTLGASVIASALFFVATNSAVWLFTDLYPQTLEGLMRCFYLALPFWRAALVGDIVYTVLFLGGMLLASRHYMPEGQHHIYESKDTVS